MNIRRNIDYLDIIARKLFVLLRKNVNTFFVDFIDIIPL